MEKYRYAILGQGSAAFAAAIKADNLKIKTVMIGHNATKHAVIGGTCVNVGCVPSKTLITEGNTLDKENYGRFPGLDYDVRLSDYSRAVEGKNILVETYRKSKYIDVLSRLKNVSFIDGLATLKSGNIIDVNGKEIKAEKILIATGARASIPAIKGLASVEYMTNEEALSAHTVPKSITFIGGGAIALELAQMFKHYGSEVHIIEQADKLLARWEPEVSDYVERFMNDEGIHVHTSSIVDEVHKKAGDIVTKVKTSGKERDIVAERLVIATGRTPNTDRLDLKALGISTDNRGFIKISKTMETSHNGVYAAGDVTGEPMLEALAAKEGNVATLNAFTKNKKKLNFNEIPAAIFTFPEVSRVGLTDKEATENGINCVCRTILFEDVPKAKIIRDARGLIKMVTERSTRKILGVEIVAENAAELIHEATLAVKEGLTVDDIIDTVHVFPTLSESIKLVAQSFYRSDITRLSCCTE